MPNLYKTDRTTQVAVKPTVSFLQDLNVLMAETGLGASEIVRQAVHTQAEAVRLRWSAAHSEGETEVV